MNVLPLMDGDKVVYLPLPEDKDSFSVQELEKLWQDYKRRKTKAEGKEMFDGVTVIPSSRFVCKCGYYVKAYWHYCPICGHKLWQGKEDNDRAGD